MRCTVNDDMDTIGEYLKRVREACGYSLGDVAVITRISLRYLEAIEDNDLDKIPGDTFYHGFIRSYAKSIGISEAEINRRISEIPKKELPAVNTQNKDFVIAGSSVGKSVTGKAIFLAAAGVILTLLLLIIFSSGRDSDIIGNSKEIKAAPAEIQEVQPEVPPQVAQNDVEPVVLKIFAHDETWISARIDDKEKKEVLLKPGDNVMWNGESKVILTVGNAGGIDLDVNDNKLSPFGKRGEVIRDAVITSSGVNKTGESVGESSTRLRQ